MANKNPSTTFADRPQDINRKGRPPKQWTWSHIIEKEVEKLGDKNLGKRNETIKKTMVKIMIEKVLQGDTQAFKELTNRTDGLPKLPVDLELKGSTLSDILEATK